MSIWQTLIEERLQLNYDHLTRPYERLIKSYNDCCRQEKNAEVTIENLRDNIDSLTKEISSHRCPPTLKSPLNFLDNSFINNEENCNELKALLNLKDSQIKQIGHKLEDSLLTMKKKDLELEEKNLHLFILQQELQDLQQEFLKISQKGANVFY